MSATPEPGPDEIVLSAPATRELCHSLEHLRAGRPAQVRVTFGELGTLFADDLWPECWHHSYPMCGPCWRAAHRTAAQRRPALVIRGATSPPASTSNGRPLTGAGLGWAGAGRTHRAAGAASPVKAPARPGQRPRRPWPRGYQSSGSPDPPSPGRRSAHGSARFSVHGHWCIVLGCTVRRGVEPHTLPAAYARMAEYAVGPRLCARPASPATCSRRPRTWR
jgi:hypothetical protein